MQGRLEKSKNDMLMNISKYAARLGKMSSDEIRFRVKQLARNRMETLRWKLSGGNGGHPQLFVPQWVQARDTGRHPFPDPAVPFFGLMEDPEVLETAFQNYFGEKTGQVLRDADELLAHRFRLLGLNVQLPDPIRWNENPQTGQPYPLHHFSQMDTFNTAQYGDVKYVWELNRHQFFIEVGKAYLLSRDEKYAEKIWQWLESWFEQVPYKFGIHHTSVLEHAVRIFSWIWAYYFTRHAVVWTSARREELARQLLLQGQMIEENLSYYYSPYNHLIGELAALAFLGTVYGNSPKTRHWREHYWQEMVAQLEKQFHPDGFTVEQASYYHHFTLGFYLQVAILRRQCGLEVAPAVWETLGKALDFSRCLTRPDGRLPMLGDIDSARSLYFYRPRDMWDLRGFQALGAVLFQRPDMKFVADGPAEELLWLLGPDGPEKYAALPAEPPRDASQYFASAGYVVLRDGWLKHHSYCLFDCGEIAHGVHRDETPSAAHGHADILSLEICLEGQPLVIDPGFHTYFGNLAWHRYFRDTRGHNTLTVNGCGQAVHENRIGWSQVASPRMEHWIFTPEVALACGSVDRFAGLQLPVRHRRYVLFSKFYGLLVFDEVTGETSQPLEVESSLHFAPGRVALQDQKLLFNDCPVGCITVPENTEFTVETGGENPEQGWMAPGYGEKLPAPVLRMKTRRELPYYAAMLFTPGAIRAKIQHFALHPFAADIPQLRVELIDCVCRIYLNPRRQHFALERESRIETDALCAMEMHREGYPSELRFLQVAHLSRGGVALPETAKGARESVALRLHKKERGK